MRPEENTQRHRDKVELRIDEQRRPHIRVRAGVIERAPQDIRDVIRYDGKQEAAVYRQHGTLTDAPSEQHVMVRYQQYQQRQDAY